MLEVLWPFYEQGRPRPKQDVLSSPQLLQHHLHTATGWDHNHIHEHAFPTARAFRDLS